MTTISRKIKINVPKEKVWQAIAKFGDICHASPAVLKSYVSSDVKEGIGATRHCDFAMMGATAEERILEWNEGESLKIGVYELKKMPGIAKMEATFNVESIDENQSYLTGTLTYSMKNIFFDAMNTMMMKKMNIKMWDGNIAGHKKYIETGEIVTEKTVLELDKVIKLN